MEKSYLDEEDLIYRLFNEFQTTPKKQEQYAEILAEFYSHSAEVFVSQFSNCVYSVLLLNGNETIPPFAPLLVDVVTSLACET